jgi:isopentenyldiphosphate isomerase
LVENGIDHVFTGIGNPEIIQPNPTEVSEHRQVRFKDLKAKLQENPHVLIPWFKQALNIALDDALQCASRKWP